MGGGGGCVKNVQTIQEGTTFFNTLNGGGVIMLFEFYKPPAPTPQP